MTTPSHPLPLTLREIAYGSTEFDQEVQLRTRILREPLGLRYTPEQLAAEATEIHLGAFADAPSGPFLVGSLILAPQSADLVKMRQFAVASAWQRQGVGRKLVQFAEEQARTRHFQEIQLHARDSAVPFYLALGYEIYGEPFMEVTLPHRLMRKTLREARG